MPDSLTVKIWRGDNTGRYQNYSVPVQKSQTVLDVVTYVQQSLDASLSYRFACRVGMCGSCAMMVNAKPAWTCRTHVDKVAKSGHLTIAPLANLEIIRDLTTDMSPFFTKWQKSGAVFSGQRSRHEKIAAIDPTNTNRRAASSGIECINCAVCYAACDTVKARPQYVGPAALNRAWTLLNDEKHSDQKKLKSSVTANGGCFSCHTHASCTNHCPVGLDPAGAIAGLKSHYSWFGSRL